MRFNNAAGPLSVSDTASLILFRPHTLYTHTESRRPYCQRELYCQLATVTLFLSFTVRPRCLVFSHTSSQEAMPRAHRHDLYEKQLITHINQGPHCSQGILMKAYTTFAFSFLLFFTEFGMRRVETQMPFTFPDCPNTSSHSI